ncbi:LURP-one-related/scramblase family protein [Niabella ginsengisoli]|uniref:Uncharacterized protein n=1 Tax=Niabella ginsengisoli TaxID=522298 RepID=A0ABS9SMD4_9BACT|nr:hypothetical protein [Niabella ginsengisoli]MCH5599522.1 hypothetical protein [Niabella ginsengisoli]
MRNLAYPLQFTFKITTIANDFKATDAHGNTIAYVREKIFRLKDNVDVYSDETKSQRLFNISANQWIDWSTSYKMTTDDGQSLGRIGRKGWRSIWKATYEIFDENDLKEFHVNEDNGWIKVGDAVLSEIPILGILTGYVFNPSYTVYDNHGTKVAQIKKQKSFWGRRFTVDQFTNMNPAQEERVALGLMMMILLERRRG